MTLLTRRQPPPKRTPYSDGEEVLMSEGAVMLAVMMWLFKQGAGKVFMHPDGLHMKGFDMPGWLEGQGFERKSQTGIKGVSGEFRRGSQIAILHSRPGLGDVIAEVDGQHWEVETKGGCINTRHPGQTSKLRKGLSEAVGQLMASPRADARLFAVVPRHPETEKLAARLIERACRVGIEIGLVAADGEVKLVTQVESSL